MQQENSEFEESSISDFPLEFDIRPKKGSGSCLSVSDSEGGFYRIGSDYRLNFSLSEADSNPIIDPRVHKLLKLHGKSPTGNFISESSPPSRNNIDLFRIFTINYTLPLENFKTPSTSR